MLRKKLLIVIMTALVISFGIVNNGQVVFANSNNEVVATQEKQQEKIETIDLDAQDSSQKFLNAVKTPDITEIKLIKTSTGEKEFNLTEEIVGSLSNLSRYLKINVGKGVTLTIENIQNDLILDGKNKLEIVRAEEEEKEGNLIQVKDGITKNVTITNVIFENSGLAGVAFRNLNTSSNVKVTLKGNTLKKFNPYDKPDYDSKDNKYFNGALAHDANNTILVENDLNDNLLYDGQLMDIYHSNETKITEGYITAYINGKIEVASDGPAKIVGGSASFGVGINPELEIKDEEDFESEDYEDYEDKVSSLKFYDVDIEEGGRFKSKFEGLESGLRYECNASFNVLLEDDNGNKYRRYDQLVPMFYTHGIEVTDITYKSAFLNIPYDKDLAYPLTLTVKNNFSLYTVSDIDREMLINFPNLVYDMDNTYILQDKNGKIIDMGTFKTKKKDEDDVPKQTGEITPVDINKSTITDTEISIPISYTEFADSIKNEELRSNYENVIVTVNNGRLELKGLIPDKEYNDMKISYVDKDFKFKRFTIPPFKTKASLDKVKQFISDVYGYALGRSADEKGFEYWEKQLRSKETSPSDFVKNLLNEKEFIAMNPKTEYKIEALYMVIVNRDSDSEGLNHWTKKYDDLVKAGNDDVEALNTVVDQMVNEQEFKNRVSELGL